MDERIGKKDKSFLWLSPFSAGIILTLTFKAAHRFPGDSHIFMYGDYLGQFMEYIVMFWRKLISGNSLFYSFNLGLGAATWEHYAFYGFSPFNIVFAFVSDADSAAFVLLLLKVCAIALCMHLFLRFGLKVKETIAVLFSVSYALCAYVINFHFCILFMDYLYILPIVMLMMIHFFRTGKSAGLIVVYAYSFLVTYYGGYMIGVFSLVCFILMLVSGEYGVSKRRLLFKYIIGVVISVLISAVVTLPTAVAVFSGRAGESGNIRNINIFVWDVLSNLFPLKRITVHTMQPSVYCGVPALVFSIGYFTDKDIEKRRKLIGFGILLFLLICTLFKPAYLMMHGFDEPDDYYFRFAFMYSFFFSSLGAMWAEKKKDGYSVYPILISAFLVILIYGMDYITSERQDNDIEIAVYSIILMFMLLYFAVIKYVSNGKKNHIIYMILLVELFVNGYYSITPDSTSMIRWKETYDLWNRHGKEALSIISEKNKNDDRDEFYRVNFRGGLWANDSMYFNYCGLGYFSSMEQRDTRKLMNELGYATSRRVVMEKGGGPFTEMIFSQKYRVDTDLDLRNTDCEKVVVEKAEQTLPIAFMVSEDILDMEMINDAFENQQELANAMTGHNNTIWKKYIGKVDSECDNATITKYDDMFFVKKNGPGTAMVELSIPTGDEEEFYAYISRKEPAADDKSPILYSDAEGGKSYLTWPSYLFMPAILRMDKKDGKSSIYIIFNEDGYEGVDFENYYFASINREGLKDFYDEINGGSLSIYKMSDDNIRGTVRVSDEKDILFCSIPYDESWHVSFDETEAETFPILDGALLGCRLPKGEHNIKIYYKNNYICIGAAISFVGVFALVMLMITEKKRDKNAEK